MENNLTNHLNKKICVYAIAKNEIKFIDRWFESVKEADYICVLDTGSTDGSFEKFLSLGTKCEQKVYTTFRFDVARNDSLKLIPDDTEICVCVDIDEFFAHGWSKILKENWNSDIGRVHYRYTWNFNPDGSEGTVFMADKIHKYGKYIWTHPVHEILTEIEKTNLITIDLPQIQLNHKADNQKSRSSYLPLLELSVKERPDDDRNTHYLAREYMFHGEYKKAIKMFKKHLSLPTATWDEERCASLRYIANCYTQLGKLKQQKYEEKLKNNLILQKNNKKTSKNMQKIAKISKNNYYFNNTIKFLHLAILTCNTAREAYFELALAYFENQNYCLSAVWFNEMFKIKNRELNYMSNPICWGHVPYDYLAMCYYHLSDFKNAAIAAKNALKYIDDERIKNNLKIFTDLFNQSQNV